jgi:hypothetical protein
MKLYSRKILIPSKMSVAFAAAALLAASLARADQDEIYVSDLYGNSISEYSLSGTPASKKPLISGSELGDPFGMAMMGNDLLVSNYATDSISEYNATTGAPIDLTFITGDGLNQPADILLDGDDLYVANIGGSYTPNNGSVEEFNVLTGKMVGTKPLITGLDYSEYMAVSGNDLYVSSWNAVYEYNATTGAMVGTKPLVTGDNIRGLAINGNDLYVVDSVVGTVTVYNATSGHEIGNKPLIGGLCDPRQIVYFNGDLYVSDVGNNTITEYNAATGKEVGCSPLISCTDNPYNFIIADPSTPAPVPEPTTWALLAAGMLVLYARLRAHSARA